MFVFLGWGLLQLPGILIFTPGSQQPHKDDYLQSLISSITFCESDISDNNVRCIFILQEKITSFLFDNVQRLDSILTRSSGN